MNTAPTNANIEANIRRQRAIWSKGYNKVPTDPPAPAPSKQAESTNPAPAPAAAK